MQTFIEVMKALSDANRVKIIKLLQVRSLCVCEIQALLGIGQPTVSKHLKILEQSGLVVSEKAGRWVNYRLSEGSTPYAAALLGNLRHWMSEDQEVQALIADLPTVKRETLCRQTL
jgi:ArsR family transcriptional regulator